MAGSYPSPASLKTPLVGNAASVQLVPQNLTRSSLYLFNASNNVIWVCPSVSTDQTPLPAAVGGLGSVPVQPQSAWFFDAFTGSLNAIAASGAANLVTVWEYYFPVNFAMTLINQGATTVPGQVPGTTTNDNAAAGNVGEYISSVVTQGSAVPLTTATLANVTSMSLTAGDWDVTAQFYFHPAATTNVTSANGSISLTSATLAGGNAQQLYSPGIVTGGADITVGVTPIRISIAVTTTVFMVAVAAFTVSTLGGYGQFKARRMR